MNRFTGHGRPIPVDPTRPPLGLAPGDSLLIHIKDYFDGIRAAVEQKMSLTQIVTFVMYRDTLFFDDGTRWNQDTYWVPNPDQPGKYVALPEDYFPGNPLKYWPHPWTIWRSTHP